MICVLGCLLTDAGVQIKQEMLEHLAEHNILCIDQDPPGKYAEYPALYYAMQVSIDTKKPVIYCHTKGAANPIPYHCAAKPGSFVDVMPTDATLADWQPSVRRMWYHEFTGNRLNEYLEKLNLDKPMVLCPYTGKGKVTWQNGFIMNSLAAQELSRKFRYTENRYWYEVMFRELPNVEVCGMIYNHINHPMDDSKFDMYKSIWSFRYG